MNYTDLFPTDVSPEQVATGMGGDLSVYNESGTSFVYLLIDAADADSIVDVPSLLLILKKYVGMGSNSCRPFIHMGRAFLKKREIAAGVPNITVSDTCTCSSVSVSFSSLPTISGFWMSGIWETIAGL